jgi:hypothetical protein
MNLNVSNSCKEMSWRVNQPLLPYQGIMVWWHKPEDSNTA